MHTLLALLAVLLPIFLIEAPTLQSNLTAMGSIRGTYDVLMVAIPLPRSDVLALLPASICQPNAMDTLLSVPETILTAIGGSSAVDQHIVVLQMGYQINTGPGPRWLPKFSFNECKIDIPHVRHPRDTDGKGVAMTYKQTVLFSNTVVRLGSTATGIDSKSATFEPPCTPNTYAADSEEIAYKADGFVEARAVKLSDERRKEASSLWQMYADFAQDWWFARATGDKLQKFDFDFADPVVAPTAYDVQLQIDLDAFRPADAGDAPLGKRTLQVTGWRSNARMASTATQVQQLLQ